MFWQAAGTAFGITAALVFGGGWILLQYKRDQMHYKLAGMALERGLQAMPGSMPGWLRSLRHGILLLLVGVGVLGSGIVFHMRAGGVDDVPASAAVDVARPALNTDAVAHPAPPPPPPGMPRWERVQQLKLIGLINGCAGGILILVGVARISFARIERQFASPAPAAGT